VKLKWGIIAFAASFGFGVYLYSIGAIKIKRKSDTYPIVVAPSKTPVVPAQIPMPTTPQPANATPSRFRTAPLSDEELRQKMAESARRMMEPPFPAGMNATQAFEHFKDSGAKSLANTKAAIEVFMFCRRTSYSSTPIEAGSSRDPAVSGCDQFDSNTREPLISLHEQAAQLGGVKEAIAAAQTPPRMFGDPGNRNDPWFARNVARLERYAEQGDWQAMKQLSKLYASNVVGASDRVRATEWMMRSIAHMPPNYRTAAQAMLDEAQRNSSQKQ
jgi:hypothetical protein